MDSAHWHARLSALTQEHGVVGSSLAVQHAGATVTAAAGVLHASTRHPVTPDSVFLVGSITKVWTATLVMQLVDEGLVDLDKPLVSWLPEFRVHDQEATEAITVRHLLCHTSGIDGDFFLDTGRGDDAIPRFVAAMAELRQNHPVGALMSYTNCGYVVLGHLVATLRQETWEQALADRLLVPLGLTRAGVFPEEAVLQSVAVGHSWDRASSQPAVFPQWGGFRSMGPTGQLHATPAELVAFAQAHRSEGVAADGTRILGAASVDAMQVPQVETMFQDEGTHWGLGWALDEWGGQRVVQHSGSLTGQMAFLTMLPDADLVVALCTNGGRAPGELYAALVAEIAQDLVGAQPRPRLAPPPEAVALDPAAYAGTYSRAGFTARLAEHEPGVLGMTVTVTGALVGLVPDMVYDVVGSGTDGVLLGREVGGDTWVSVVFFEQAGDRYFHASGRAFRRETDA